MQFALVIMSALTVCLVLRATSSSQEPPAAAVSGDVQRLAAWVGTWDAEVSMMGETSKGTEVCRMECGGLWLTTEHKGSFMGAPYQGKGFTGFDAQKGAYAGAWIDSTGGPMSTYDNGRFSADGKTFTAEVAGAGPDGAPARFEYVSTFPDARTRTFEIFEVGAGKRALMMGIRYTKRG
jgi:hypothetical protein